MVDSNVSFAKQSLRKVEMGGRGRDSLSEMGSSFQQLALTILVSQSSRSL